MNSKIKPETEKSCCVSILLPIAIDDSYTYKVADGSDLKPGDVVEVPLGPRKVIGCVWDDPLQSDIADEKLKSITQKIDCPPLSIELQKFCDWMARYTLIPRGMLLRMVLRNTNALYQPKPQMGVVLDGAPPKRITPARQRIIELAEGGLAWLKNDLAAAAGSSPAVVNGLLEAGTLKKVELPPEPSYQRLDPDHVSIELNEEQFSAAGHLINKVRNGGQGATLIDGVTGSGKTEVYLEVIAETLRQGKQALVLLPEIALTSQFLDRFEKRFGAKPAEWHSELTAKQRENCWRAVHRSEAHVVVGARSALFLPFANLGLIVVDEEHDPAYKQTDQGTYHARDMAVTRGHLAKIPVILASATASIETRVNIEQDRYNSFTLKSRYGGATLPEVKCIDLKQDPVERGRWISPILKNAVHENLERKEQSLLFLNRRGYAPLTICRTCGHRITCPNCTAWLVHHRLLNKLTCHHCGYSIWSPKKCPNCDSENSLVASGPGVERIGEEVSELFPDARIVILSSDFIQSMAELRQTFNDIEAGNYDIIVGTQLIAKGHHFPLLSLVGIIDADLGLGHGDLRASERTFQLLHQVVGRAGRDKIKGRGLIQTYNPDHPVMQALCAQDPTAFYNAEIEARKLYALPPFGRLAAIIISGKDKSQAEAYGQHLAKSTPQMQGVIVLGPAEAPIAMVRGRHRLRLLVKAERSFDIQTYLRSWISTAGDPKGGVRMSIDIDPQSFL